MKKMILSAFAGAFAAVAATMAMGTLSASADQPFPPDCHLEGINNGIDGVLAQITSSPALGHAGGHYGRAAEDLKRVKIQLHDGCFAWNHDRH